MKKPFYLCYKNLRTHNKSCYSPDILYDKRSQQSMKNNLLLNYHKIGEEEHVYCFAKMRDEKNEKNLKTNSDRKRNIHWCA